MRCPGLQAPRIGVAVRNLAGLARSFSCCLWQRTTPSLVVLLLAPSLHICIVFHHLIPDAPLIKVVTLQVAARVILLHISTLTIVTVDCAVKVCRPHIAAGLLQSG